MLPDRMNKKNARTGAAGICFSMHYYHMHILKILSIYCIYYESASSSSIKGTGASHF
jgi:hypothetical protein